MPYGTVNVDSVVNSDGVTSGGLYGFKNRIINGSAMTDQRNNNGASSITVASGGSGYPVDRFYIENNLSGTITAQQSTTAPAGFTKSIIHTVSSTDTPAAGDYLFDSTSIEGLNMADLGWGTASAQAVTISFWVRSSVTGTYGVGLRNGATNYSYVSTYTVNAANTWEQKTITVAGPTSGTWYTDNSLGVRIFWDLGSGSDFNGTANAWQSGTYWRTSACVNWISNSGATFYITGVQLEKGSTATSFDYRPYGTELALCQRYYYKWTPTTSAQYIVNASALSATDFFGASRMPVTMRTSPTLTTSGTATDYGGYHAGGAGVSCSAVPIIDTSNADTPLLRFTFSGGGTSGYTGIFGSRTTNGFLGFNSEL